MQDTTSFRFLPYASTALASLALALSTYTACQSRGDSGEVTLESAVQGERSTVGKQEAAAPQEATQPALPASKSSAAAEAPLPPADEAAAEPKAAAQPKAAGETPKPDQPKPLADVPPQVKRLVLATDVQNREPIALEGAARAGEPLTAFIELANTADAPANIIVTFEHAKGDKVGFVELSVPESSPRYRTWARTRQVRTPGAWHAVVTHKGGEEIARQSFTVEAAPPAPTTPDAPVQTPDAAD